MNQKMSNKSMLGFIYLLIIASVVQATVSVKVYSRDEVLKTFNASKPRIYIKNTGTESISNVYYNYYFETENGKVPLLGDYYTPVEAVSLVADGGSKYHIKYVINATIQPGQILPDAAGNVIGLNYNTWDAWDKTNDYSNTLDSTFKENPKITVYINNVKVYGTEPGGTAPPSEASVQLNSFALYSTQGTMLRERSSFSGGGAVGSNTSVELGTSAVVNGNVVSAGTVLLRTGSAINGIVYANGTVTQESGVSLSNPVHNNAGLGILTIPAIAVTSGSLDKTVYAYQTIDLAPGIYRNLVVQTNGTIKFQPGNYSFNSFTFQTDAHAIFTVAMNQKLEIDVAGEFEINDRATMQFTGIGYAPAVKFYTNDPNTIRIGCDTKMTGIVYAPNAEISVAPRAQCDGAIYAKKITVESDAKVFSGLVNPDGDADNDHVPNLLEVQTGTNPSDPRSFKMMAIPHPVTIDNSADQVVYYSLADFYEDYSNTDSLAMHFPAGALVSGAQNLPISISNSPIDFAGNAIASPELPTGMNLVGRYIAIDQGELTPDLSFDMSIPVPDADINNSSQYSVIYTSTSGGWKLADALTSVDSDGKITVTATVVNPLVVALVCKKISATAYLDDGVVFSNEKGFSDAVLDIDVQCKGFTDNSITGTLIITYTDYAVPSTPVVKTLPCRLSRMSLPNTPPNSNLVYKDINFKFPNKIKITKTEFVFSDASLNSSSVQNLTVNPNECLKIDADKDISLFKPGIDPLTCQFVTRYSFESADIDGEGRIHKSNAGVFSYDFYLKDHLGSTRAVVNDNSDVTEATDYLPYGTMVPLMLAPVVDNARGKFTGKEFDSGVNPISEVSFDIKINNFDAGGRYSGLIVVDYTDLSNNKLIRKCYSLKYDPDAKKFTLNTAERFPVNVKVINIRIATTGYVTSINYEKAFDLTVTTDNGLTISLDVNGSDLITNAGTNFYTTSTYVPYRVAGSNLYYFGARYYDPELGVWGSTDPAEQFWNSYSYVGGQPINNIDPSGRTSFPIYNRGPITGGTSSISGGLGSGLIYNFLQSSGPNGFFPNPGSGPTGPICYDNLDDENGLTGDGMPDPYQGITVDENGVGHASITVYKNDGTRDGTSGPGTGNYDGSMQEWVDLLTLSNILDAIPAPGNQGGGGGISNGSGSCGSGFNIGDFVMNVLGAVAYSESGAKAGTMYYDAAFRSGRLPMTEFMQRMGNVQSIFKTGRFLGNVALPVGVASAVFNSSIRFAGRDYYGCGLELFAAGASTGVGLYMAGSVALSTSVFWVPVLVGVGTYYGVKTTGNLIAGRDPFDY